MAWKVCCWTYCKCFCQCSKSSSWIWTKGSGWYYRRYSNFHSKTRNSATYGWARRCSSILLSVPYYPIWFFQVNSTTTCDKTFYDWVSHYSQNSCHGRCWRAWWSWKTSYCLSLLFKSRVQFEKWDWFGYEWVWLVCKSNIRHVASPSCRSLRLPRYLICCRRFRRIKRTGNGYCQSYPTWPCD